MKAFGLRRVLEIGGVVSGAILIALGITTLVIGLNGRSTVHNSLKREQIVGSPDMTPAGIAAEAKKAKLPASISLPGCSVAGQLVDNGDKARCFASYMRIHTLEATGGYTYAQMGRYQARPNAPAAQLAKGGGTDNPAYAVIDPTTKQPVSNHARDIWVTETALTTALNTSYMAERISLFGLMVGITLLLSGLGFAILALGGALRNRPERAPRPTAKLEGAAQRTT